MPDFENTDVAQVFDGFPAENRELLLQLRALVFKVAEETPAVADLSEELRWGQPAYLNKNGSTLRLGIPKTGGAAVYVHCQTSILTEFRDLFPTDFDYEGNRAVLFKTGSKPDFSKLEQLIRRALTYHVKGSDLGSTNL